MTAGRGVLCVALWALVTGCPAKRSEQRVPIRDVAELAGEWVGTCDIRGAEMSRLWYQWVSLSADGGYVIRLYATPIKDHRAPPATSVTHFGAVESDGDGGIHFHSSAGGRGTLNLFQDAEGRVLKGGGFNAQDNPLTVEWRRIE